MGEMIRQHYWLPAVPSIKLEADGAPVRIRLLGKNFIAFRVTDGTAGVIDEQCPHRKASLALGRNEDNGIRFDIPIMNGTEQGTVGWQGSFIQPKETVDSKAVFGQTTWNATDSLHVTGGLRYTSDERKNIGGTNNGWSDSTAPQVPVNPSMNPLAPGSGFSTYQHNDATFTDHKLTGLVRVAYDIDKNNMVYASVSTGYK